VVGAAFGFEPYHFEQVAEGLEAGVARQYRKIRRQRCDVAGYRRAITGLVGWIGLLGHLNSVPVGLPAKLRCVGIASENTQFDSNSNLFNSIYNEIHL
jgi:hypothetical protein